MQLRRGPSMPPSVVRPEQVQAPGAPQLVSARAALERFGIDGHRPLASWPGLTRPSRRRLPKNIAAVRRVDSFDDATWLAGSSPAMTTECGSTQEQRALERIVSKGNHQARRASLPRQRESIVAGPGSRSGDARFRRSDTDLALPKTQNAPALRRRAARSHRITESGDDE